ncbi:hypothetical protein ABIA32_002398 [Streptacidiphilus sp. MAP12-20]|uniref:hypothetical protein n=1 Tax=Streptacidiphilus sp. MAP12-20 TaxID=3156299 RepID=UPI00351950E9
MTRDLEDALRAEFTARAQQLTCGAAPYPALRRRIARRRRALTAELVAAAALVSAVGIGAGLTLDHPRPSPGVAVTTAPLAVGGCGSTPLYRGAPPAWTAVAQAPADLTYVVSSEGNAVGFLFVDPLHAGTGTGSQNKILWVVRSGGAGGAGSGPLAITGRPLDSPAAGAQLRVDEPGLGGGVYPSITDVPAPGCWHLTLNWAGGSATVDLPYGPFR